MVKKKIKEEKDNHRIPLSKFTKGGLTSCLMGLISLLIIIVSIIISIILRGKAGIYIGLMMLVALGVSIAGFAVGLKSFNEGSKFLKFTYIGTIFNAVIWLFVMGMYLAFV